MLALSQERALGEPDHEVRHAILIQAEVRIDYCTNCAATLPIARRASMSSRLTASMTSKCSSVCMGRLPRAHPMVPEVCVNGSSPDIDMASLSYFSPHSLAVGARARGCLTCEHFQGELFGSHVVCRQRDKPSVIGDARIGCAWWVRAIGADDT